MGPCSGLEAAMENGSKSAAERCELRAVMAWDDSRCIVFYERAGEPDDLYGGRPTARPMREGACDYAWNKR